MSRLYKVEIDETGLPVPSAEMDQERRVAIFDLEESNSFALVDGPEGALALTLGLQAGQVRFDLANDAGRKAAAFTLSIAPLMQAIKDYATLCDSYAEAVKTLPPARIEAVDAARRDIHTEAARQLQSALAPHVTVDAATARRLFTLISVMARDD